VIEAGGNASAFRMTSEAVRPRSGHLGSARSTSTRNVRVSLGFVMQRNASAGVSYGNARPRRDFPRLARAYLDGSLMWTS